MHVRNLIVASALAVGLAGCSKSGQSATESGTGGMTIGVSIQNREAQFYQQMEAGMRDEAKKFGYTLVVDDANRDNARQQSQVEDFITQKVGAIVLTPYDSKAIGSAIVEANAAKIPVFTADIANQSAQGTVVAHIASDNVQGGAQAAKLICEALPDHAGAVAIVDEPEVTSVQDRVKGFRQELAAHCPGAKVVQDVDGGGERAKSSSVTEDVLQAHKDVRGIFGINDDSALGAATAVSAAGLSGKIAIVGYDATPEARTAIKSGRMYGDAIQHPEEIGKLTVDAIHDYASGTTPKAVIAVPVGTYTKANAASS